MDAKHTPRKTPERVVDLDAARRQHGAKADHVVALLTAGDPLADAVMAELDLYGPQARHALHRQAHYWQTYSPASSHEARRRALEGPAPELRAAVVPCDTSCRRNAGGVRPGAWAA
ncbi:hypothetical protein ACFPH6_46325 [Streptomyces xiangluensis]|uniref:Uncharacterized protein n=1 Tax=Streptomyces xiangluensis TaxID=2665720 RepID=A0ABV8Z674_9ACTN